MKSSIYSVLEIDYDTSIVLGHFKSKEAANIWIKTQSKLKQVNLIIQEAKFLNSALEKKEYQEAKELELTYQDKLDILYLCKFPQEALDRFITELNNYDKTIREL